MKVLLKKLASSSIHSASNSSTNSLLLVKAKLKSYFAALICLLTLTACQSTINKAEQEHKITVGKFQALIQYGESALPEYGISITAQLTQQPKKHPGSTLSYQLSNIKLNDQTSYNNINLLSPWFSNSYICTPVCSQLTEYKSKTDQGGTTLLNYYFKQHQYEFYDFYIEIYKINKQLVQLKQIQPLLVKDYLLYLVDQHPPQTSLMDFVRLLTQSLSPAAYQLYLQQPVLRVGEYKAFTKNEQDNWDLTQDNSESEGWQKFTSKNAEIQVWQNADGNNQTKKSLVIPSLIQWEANKNNNLAIGDLACSYQENMFGKVIALHKTGSNKNNTVSLSLLGVVKAVHDGIIKNQVSGYLFNTGHQTMNFKPIKGVKTFSANDIAKCLFK